jgi:hypothetical protein
MRTLLSTIVRVCNNKPCPHLDIVISAVDGEVSYQCRDLRGDITRETTFYNRPCFDKERIPQLGRNCPLFEPTIRMKHNIKKIMYEE